MEHRPELAVGIIDSGVRNIGTADSRRFVLDENGEVMAASPQTDQLGHGTAMAKVILQQAPGAALYSAQVFSDRLSCSARQVAKALDWLVSREVRLVNMSFGLREDRAVLREACRRAAQAGVILVASSPARGDAVWPAAYEWVISATGDARCGRGEISALGTGQVEFAGHVRCTDERIAGASVGCAHISGFSARCLRENPGVTANQLRQWLDDQASYRGPERRSS